VKGELPEDLHWAALADPHAMTAVYMGKKTFPALAARLIAQGLSPDTPALLAESVGQADQRLVRTTVGKLAEQLAQENVTATAVILYGALAADDP
jgi:uroporphyrin-III C-methyltransferase